jgi:hypothetical protein
MAYCGSKKDALAGVLTSVTWLLQDQLVMFPRDYQRLNMRVSRTPADRAPPVFIRFARGGIRGTQPTQFHAKEQV